MPLSHPVLIAGAGIAGAAAALALARQGAEVTLVEAAAPGAGQGGGLQISPNGVRVLDALGLGGAARGLAVPSRAVVLLDGFTDRRITRLDLGSHAREGLDYLLFRRNDLVRMLTDAAEAAGVRVVRPAEVSWLGQDAEGVRIALDGEERRVPLALAADGFHSAARALLNGAETPAFTGQVAWRATVPGTAPPETRAWLGPGMHLVSYPLIGGQRNVVAVEERADWAAEGWHHADDPANLRAAFASFGREARALLDAVQEVRLWGLYRRPVAKVWHGPRLCLLGDAAHPTLPFMAQGANMALEDAWVLADCLTGAETPAIGFAGFQARREARAARAIAAADANARNYHLRGVMRYAAHRTLWLGGMVAPKAALRRFDWLYRHDVTQAAGRMAEGRRAGAPARG